MSTTALLDDPDIRERLTRLSVQDFQQMTELGVFARRTILIRGLLIDKMSKSALHLSTAKYLYDLFSRLTPSGFSVRQDGPLTLADSVPEPDVAVVRGSDAEYRARHPASAELVVEVAVSSLLEDREMCGVYAEAGIAEYWIVVARERKVEVYRDPHAGAYREVRVHQAPEELLCRSVPELRVPLAELFA